MLYKMVVTGNAFRKCVSCNASGEDRISPLAQNAINKYATSKYGSITDRRMLHPAQIISQLHCISMFVEDPHYQVLS